MLYRLFLIFSLLCTFCQAELPDHFFSKVPSTSDTKTIGRITITDRKNGINEATWIYVKAALDTYRKERPRCIVLELDTPGGELYTAQRISTALKNFEEEECIPVIAYVNNWAISAGALLAYSCRYIVIAKDACIGAATPIYAEKGDMTVAPEKINSVVRAEFANKAALFGRNQDIARAMVDPDILLVRREGKIIALHDEAEILKDPLQPDEIISPKGKLLTLTAQELIDFKVANFLATESIYESAKADSFVVTTFEMTTKEKIISFLALPAVSAFLAFIAMVCLYIEFSTPGVSIPGLIGGIAFFLVLLGSFAQEAITWFEPLCFFAGILLIFVEVSFFPTFGFLLLVGGLLSLFGLLGILIPGLKDISFQADAFSLYGGYLIHRLGWISGAFLLALCTCIFLARFLMSRSIRLSGIILTETMPTPEENIDVKVGDIAKVIAPMRPAGKILLQEKLFSAISKGEFIEKDSLVVVTEIRGNTIVVKSKEKD